MTRSRVLASALVTAGMLVALNAPDTARATQPGIMVNQNGDLVVKFTSLKCSFFKARGTKHFKALGTADGWKIGIYVNDFTGYDDDYEIDYGSSKNNIEVTPPSGDRHYSNIWEPDFPINKNGGDVAFKHTKSQTVVGAGFLAAFSEQGSHDGSDGVQIAGRATCAHKKKK